MHIPNTIKTLPVGKLNMDLLQRVLRKHTSTDDRVVLGSAVGEDAAVIDFGDTYLVAKTDPITFVTDDIGWYAIVINANDLVTRGATPKWFLATILLPEKTTTEATVDRIFAQLSNACATFGIALCGGHTEVTYGLDRPIVVGQMLGEVAKDRLVTTSGAQVGDVIVLTKGLAVEATSIIASVKRQDLQRRYSSEFVDSCLQFTHVPGISVIEDALTAVACAPVSAMHDPTEGGLATALHEVAEAAGVGVTIDYDFIPIYPETEQLCQDYGLEPLEIASGALVLTAAPRYVTPILDGLRHKGIPGAVIGSVDTPATGRKIVKDGREIALPIYHQDEITKIFA